MFEEMWLKHAGYDVMVKEAWVNRSSHVHGLNDMWR
jgi:hypothetical protein